MCTCTCQTPALQDRHRPPEPRQAHPAPLRQRGGSWHWGQPPLTAQHSLASLQEDSQLPSQSCCNENGKIYPRVPKKSHSSEKFLFATHTTAPRAKAPCSVLMRRLRKGSLLQVLIQRWGLLSCLGYFAFLQRKQSRDTTEKKHAIKKVNYRKLPNWNVATCHILSFKTALF